MTTSGHLHLRVLLICAFASGCGGDSNSSTPTPTPSATPLTVAQEIARLEDEGTIPKLDRSSALAGTDANTDGVRDDIATYIASLPYDASQKTALMQLASSLQMALTADISDPAAMDAARLAIGRGINCVFSSFPAAADTARAAQVTTDLQELTMNTKERVKAYLVFTGSSDGVVLPNPSGDTCD